LRGLLKAHQDEIEFAEPDLPMHVPENFLEEPGPSTASSLWHLNRMGVPRAGYTGRGTHIYVMDTGVRSTHEDFGGRAVPTLDTLAGGGTPVECNGDATCGTDYHGHGTHVASSAGGTSYGVAPQSTLYVMKVCCGAGTNTLGGMDWIVRNAVRPAIMTVSLASQGRSESARRGVDRVVNAGIIVTVGAANDNVDTCTMTYGFIPSAISVGATDSNDRRARFSNWGRCNDIYAPGVAIFGAWNDADSGTRSISGTSMATPMVAGASALLLEQDATRSPAKVLELLQARSIRGVISDLQPGDPDMLLTVAA
jgi:subtilisin family serine protease